MSSSYDPNLTFEANVRNIVIGVLGPNLTPRDGYLIGSLTDLMRDTYEDGWLNARAICLAGDEPDDIPDKTE